MTENKDTEIEHLEKKMQMNAAVSIETLTKRFELQHYFSEIDPYVYFCVKCAFRTTHNANSGCVLCSWSNKESENV